MKDPNSSKVYEAAYNSENSAEYDRILNDVVKGGGKKGGRDVYGRGCEGKCVVAMVTVVMKILIVETRVKMMSLMIDTMLVISLLVRRMVMMMSLVVELMVMMLIMEAMKRVVLITLGEILLMVKLVMMVVALQLATFHRVLMRKSF